VGSVVPKKEKKSGGSVLNVSILCIDVPKIPFCMWMCSTLTPHLPKHLVVLIMCVFEKNYQMYLVI